MFLAKACCIQIKIMFLGRQAAPWLVNPSIIQWSFHQDKKSSTDQRAQKNKENRERGSLSTDRQQSGSVENQLPA